MRRAMLVTLLLLVPCLAEETTQNCSGSNQADELLQSIDESVEPCDDFYHYACGGWLQRQFLTPESERVEFLFTGEILAATRKMLAEPHKPTDLDAEKKAKSLYVSCLHHDSGSTEDAAIVNAVTERFGRWPLSRRDNVTGYDLESFLVDAAHIGVFPLFSLNAFHFASHNHTTKSSRRDLYVNPPVLGLPMKDYATFDQEPEYRQIYADTISAAARRFNIDYNTTRQEVLDVVAVEETLGKIFSMVDATESNETTLDSLDNRYGELMNWTRFVQTLAALPNIDISDIAVDEHLRVNRPTSLYAAINYFVQLPERTQVNYIIWSVVDSLQNALMSRDFKLGAILQHAVLESDQEQFRDEACTNFVTEAFHLVVHRWLYGAISPEKLQQVEEMVKQMKELFTDQLPSHTWLDNETAQFIEDKIDSITTSAMYLTKAMNNATVEAYYSNVTIDEGNFTNNVIATRMDDFEKNLRSIRTFAKSETHKAPEKRIAAFTRSLHEISFTSRVFQPPWFMDNAPMVLNYAGAGFALGHEIGHSVDNAGSQLHLNGTYITWRNETILNSYIRRLICLANQYNIYMYKPAGKLVKGIRTLSENVADSVGFQLAHRAYRNYTRWTMARDLRLPGVLLGNEEVFFIRAAQNWCRKETGVKSQQTMQDTHSPTEFRINGPLRNFEEFSRVFSCPIGSRMNPVKKCPVW